VDSSVRAGAEAPASPPRTPPRMREVDADSSEVSPSKRRSRARTEGSVRRARPRSPTLADVTTPLRRSVTIAGTAVKSSAQAVTSSAIEARLHYDKFQAPVFNFFYDILQLSSGRDKVVAFIQNFAKFGSDALCLVDSERYWIFRGVEENLSDSRKVFRFLKWLREVYKVRRGLHRADEGLKKSGVCSIDFSCGVMDVLGHTCSFFYFLLDNLTWAVSVGVLQANNQVPDGRIQRRPRVDGLVVAWLGGEKGMKRWKNYSSMYRLYFALAANVLLLYKCWRDRRRQRAQAATPALGSSLGSSSSGGGAGGSSASSPLDDPLLFHSLEVLGMLCNYRVLLSKLGVAGWGASHAYMGFLGMAAASQGVWRNWRKVVQKKCGSKFFTPSVLHDSPRISPAVPDPLRSAHLSQLSLDDDDGEHSGGGSSSSSSSSSSSPEESVEEVASSRGSDEA
jgi:hypothetical protein